MPIRTAARAAGTADAAGSAPGTASGAAPAASGAAVGGDFEQAVEIDVRADDGTDRRHALARGIRLVARHQAELALDDLQPRIAGDGAEHADVGVVLDHGAQLLLVPAAAEVVEDDAGDADVAIERLVAEDQRRDAARHAAGVDDQDDRQRERLGERRVAVAAVEREPVVEPLVALDDRDVRVRRVAQERAAAFALVRQVGIEVAAGAAGGERQPHRVDVVGPLLERLDRETAGRERGAQAHAHRRLAGGLVRGGDQQPRRVRGRRHQSAPPAAGAPFDAPARGSATGSSGANGSAARPTNAIRKAIATPPRPSSSSGRLGT